MEASSHARQSDTEITDYLIERLEPFNAATINLFEARIRLTTDAQRSLARRIAYEPAQTVISATADLTRDIGAAYVSCARWLLRA